MIVRSVFLTTCLSCGLLGVLADVAAAQHARQRPPALMKKADVEKIVGPVSDGPLSKARHIVWVWGYDANHGPGNVRRSSRLTATAYWRGENMST